MLSRTADNLYWIARYMERAETMARLLQVGERMSLLPNPGGGGFRNEWDSLLQASGTAEGFAHKYGEAVQRNIESYIFFDHDNPSSIASCVARARENARIVRTALTAQVWDALNTAFQELRQLERTARSELDIPALAEWTTNKTAMVKGAIDTTLLRNDGWDFLHLGYNLERADNTARLMDVKYYVLLPQVDLVGTGYDNYQWVTLLRALSVHRAFRWAYGGEVTARKIADFLILNQQCPRALIACASGMVTHLDRLAAGYARPAASLALARRMRDDLAGISLDAVFDVGLHEFLGRFVGDVAELTRLVHEDYLSGDVR